ncbi:MAG: helix-turn-helix transcriptional regulator, partial [Firmicutes bacterium]|nr:helix-turn-helix transcriptional regulator [Bacillota bacterium]
DHAYLTAARQVSAEKSGEDPWKKFSGLSKRECQVASRLLQGKTYRVIGAELSISENTVKYYVKNIYSKYNIQSRAELIRIVLGEEKEVE